MAAKAGVSTCTVSLALRNHPSIPSATRQRVQAIAEEIGYRTNPLVSALMSLQRAGRVGESAAAIGIVEMIPNAGPGTRQYLDPAAASTVKAATKLGYHADRIGAYEKGMSARRIRQILDARGIRGIILTQPPDLPPEWRIDWSEFSVVHFTDPTTRYNRVLIDVITSMRMILAELWARGYKRPGLAVGNWHEYASGERWQLVLNNHYYLHGTDNPVPEFIESWEPERLVAWYKRHRPDVVISIGNEALIWLQEAGYRPPQDVGYVNAAISPRQQGLTAGMDTLFDERMEVAVGLLDAQMRRNEVGPGNPQLVVNIAPRWQDGPTVRPRLDAPAPVRAKRKKA